MSILEVRDLRRTFTSTSGVPRRHRKSVEAVRGVSFDVEPGEIFGLLGPNGAGKTTTIKMLITLLLPTSGGASILGMDVVKDAREVRKRIGYVFGGDRGLYDRPTDWTTCATSPSSTGCPPGSRSSGSPRSSSSSG